MPQVITLPAPCAAGDRRLERAKRGRGGAESVNFYSTRLRKAGGRQWGALRHGSPERPQRRGERAFNPARSECPSVSLQIYRRLPLSKYTSTKATPSGVRRRTEQPPVSTRSGEAPGARLPLAPLSAGTPADGPGPGPGPGPRAGAAGLARRQQRCPFECLPQLRVLAERWERQ